MNALAARLSALVLIALALPSAAIAQGAAAPAPPLSLRVMTYNLRYASDKPPNAWPDRRALMRNVIRRAAPDIIGTQEGVYSQLKDLAAGLRDYDWIGLGRDGGSRGEFMAIFYRRSRFEPVAFDHFWLSDTPEVIGSATWGHSNRRMVTWVRFRDKPTGREFYVWNTHLDHQVEEARQKAAALIRERLSKVEASLPLVLTGDFNCPAGGCAAYEILTKGAGLADAWTLADRRVNEGIDTFNGFGPARNGGVRIDWILVRGEPAAPRAETITYGDRGRFPSDHFPVVAQLRF